MLRGKVQGVARVRIAAITAAAIFSAMVITTVVTRPAQGQPHSVSRAVVVKAATPQYVAVTAAPAVGDDVDQAQDTAQLLVSVAATHEAHINHLAHEAHLAALAQAREQAAVSHPAAPAQPATSSSSAPQSYGGSFSGTLGCSGLEALWRAAGGSPGAAWMAASIAMAESGGNQYAVSPTADYGYWQINRPSWGSMASFDPITNAHAAIQISYDGSNWGAWTTYTSGAYQGKC